MDYSDKIKALQEKAGIEVDGIASSKTWLNIYYLLFNSLPYNINVNAIIKAIQEKIEVRADGYPWAKTWDALYQLLITDEQSEVKDDILSINQHNEIALNNMTKEVVPFAKELIHLATAQGIHVRLISNVSDKAKTTKGNENFGLTFSIVIVERTETGELIDKDQSPLYAEVAKLGESIGLTWARDLKTFTSQPHFQLRPAWAVAMKESDMVKELQRRKQHNLNFLAFL
jgi:peptidoglycan L-alanyl-D-glutamate endopeptidase CwlK